MAISDVAGSKPNLKFHPPAPEEAAAAAAAAAASAGTKAKSLEELAEERRRSNRATLVTAATMRPADGEAEEETKIYVANISLHGIAFRCRKSFAKGSQHYLKLSAGPLKLESLVCIQWCRQRTDGTFDVGSQFVEPVGGGGDLPKKSA